VLPRQPQAAAVQGARGLAQEMFGQFGDVVLSLAQRRDLDEEDAQPVVEVLAKAARRDLAGEIAIGGRDEPYVDVARTVLSYALVLAFLNGAEELGLQLERDLADLVEKERAAVGRLEPAYPIPEGAGERALHVAEELALEQVCRSETSSANR
jgi:hypothetical protein